MKSKSYFVGFPPETFTFLAELEQNNTREWFNARIDLVEHALIDPSHAYVSAFGERIRRIYPGVVFDPRTNGRGSMFRMNRDIRFSKDKSPYRTNLGFRFWGTDIDRASKRVKLFVKLDKNGIRVYGGIHGPIEPVILATLREAIAQDGDGELRRILKVLAKKDFESYGEQMSRVPRGYAPGHPNADLLRFRSVFMASPIIWSSIAETDAVIEQCAAYATALRPLNVWLTTALHLPPSK